MFERFTDQARRSVILSQEEARALGHDHIGPEHILLGLRREGDGIAAKALEAHGITLEATRRQVEQVIGRSQEQPSGHLPFTRPAKKALKFSLQEAIHLGHNYIGTEHILLGLIREDDSPVAQLLGGLGTDARTIRRQVHDLLHGMRREDEPSAVSEADVTGQPGREKRKLPDDLRARFGAIEARLAALERRVGGVGSELRDLDREIVWVRRDKEAAIDAGDFEQAAALRDREAQLVEEQGARRQAGVVLPADLASLTEEVQQLRDLLRRHGIDPQDGAA